MMLKKKLLLSLMMLSTSAVYAAINNPYFEPGNKDIIVINNTDKFSTSRINDGMCSSGLPSNGKTEPHKVNRIPELVAKLACGDLPNNCKADVYLTEDCSGPILSSVIFDIDTGVKSASPSGIPGYDVTFGGFGFSLNQV